MSATDLHATLSVVLWFACALPTLIAQLALTFKLTTRLDELSSKAKWQSVEDLMLQFGGLTKKSANVESYYTNEFLPKK